MGWQPLDEFCFDHQLAAQAGRALVMFGQPGCGACRGWYQQLPSWLAADDIKLFYVDVAAAQALASRFELFHLPAFVLYRDGHYHRAFSAPCSATAVRESLAAAWLAHSQDGP